MYNEGFKTFTANGVIGAHVRVKLTAGSTTVPPQVEVAGAGEQHIGTTEFAVADTKDVTVKLRTYPGTHEGIATIGSAIAVGTVLYGAASGKISDTSNGTAIGIACEAAVSNNDVIEFLDFTVISTTAAEVSVADSNSNMTGETVEAVLDELEKAVKTAQYTITPDRMSMEDGTAITAFASADSATGGFAQVSNKDVGFRWNNHATPADIAVHFTLPQDYNDGSDLVVHILGAVVKAGESAVDSPAVTIEAYFESVGAAPAAGSDVGGDSAEFTAIDNYAEKTLTITAANVPAAPCGLTLIVHPKDGQLGTDDFLMAGIWLEATRKALTT